MTGACLKINMAEPEKIRHAEIVYEDEKGVETVLVTIDLPVLGRSVGVTIPDVSQIAAAVQNMMVWPKRSDGHCGRLV
jgi:hypothetical protein